MDQTITTTDTKDAIQSAYLTIRDKHQLDTLSAVQFVEESEFTKYQVNIHFGSWNNLKRTVGEPVETDSLLTKLEVEETARAIHRKHGEVTSGLMTEAGCSFYYIRHHFGSFDDMLCELGFAPERINAHTLTRDELVANLVFLEDRFGYVNRTLNETYSKIPTHLYNKKFGTFGEACLKTHTRHIGQHTINMPGATATRAFEHIGTLIKDTYYHTELSFNWLRNEETDYPMPVDAYYPYSNLIVEFQGPQHYTPNHFFSQHKGDTLEETQKRDALKRELVLDKGFRYLRVYDYEVDRLEWLLRHRIESL